MRRLRPDRQNGCRQWGQRLRGHFSGIREWKDDGSGLRAKHPAGRGMQSEVPGRNQKPLSHVSTSLSHRKWQGLILYVCSCSTCMKDPPVLHEALGLKSVTMADPGTHGDQIPIFERGYPRPNLDGVEVVRVKWLVTQLRRLEMLILLSGWFLTVVNRLYSIVELCEFTASEDLAWGTY